MSKKNLNFAGEVLEITEQAAAFQNAFDRVREKKNAEPMRPSPNEAKGKKPNLRKRNLGQKRAAPSPSNGADLSRTESLPRPQAVAAEEDIVVQLSTKITRSLLDRLETSYLERRRKKLTPWKKQEIVMAALTEWFERNGH